MHVRVDMGRTLEHIEDMRKRALYAASEQALTDCNFYVPVRDGFLRGSSETASDVDAGRLVWATPYARRRHYEKANLRLDMNPNASIRWTEKAKQNHLDDWREIAEKAMGKKR